METVEQLVSFHHIQVQLNGGAPWGFTLKGGLEHGEPLIITKIEDGGKAAHCKRLKVGDELININGSALYGSRQEALILIKGSYRILKLTVRRRSVPLIRPHSWHLAKLSEPLPRGLEPVHFKSQLFVSVRHLSSCLCSDLSMQWSQLPRPYSSTDRSSSLGSMESLDTPTPTTQPYSDSHNSPVDPTLFNNKRDSAYSSFSASSNTSDYAAVPLRPGEASSMDNLLQSLGPAYQGYPGEASTLGRSPGEAPHEAHLIMHKSRSLTRPKTRPAEVKGRPSSCCYEHDQREGGLDIVRNGESQVGRENNPPQPPTRKDSFRATRSRTNDVNKHCISSQRQIDEFRHIKCDGSSENYSKSEAPSEHLSDSIPTSIVPITPSASASLPSESSTEIQGQSYVEHCRTNCSSASLHRHSAPEKLLATQLQLLQFNSNDSSLEPFNPSHPSDRSVSPCSSHTQRKTQPFPHHGKGEDGASVERLEAVGVNGRSLSPVHHHTPWGRSVSVPGEPTGSTTRERLNSDQMAESDFQPLSAAASVDTLLDEQMLVEKRMTGDKNEEVAEREESTKKSSSSKNIRRNRRRSERFATNLRNEIQRKKAQLQRGHGPGGLLCSRETVQEEECSDLCEDGTDPNRPVQNKSAKVAFATPGIPQDSQTSSQVKTSQTSREPDRGISQTRTTSIPQGNNQSRSVQILDPGVPSFGVGIRVVEEPAPAGKARRWRWTPEHKLQPEPDGDRRCGVSGESRSSLSSRIEESDILPFADRMKFFEETSKGIPVSNTSKRSNHRQNQPDRHQEQQTGDSGQNSTQRRYSYQGVQEESAHPPNNVEPRRQSVSAIRERQKEMEREQDCYSHSGIREQEREIQRLQCKELHTHRGTKHICKISKYLSQADSGFCCSGQIWPQICHQNIWCLLKCQQTFKCKLATHETEHIIFYLSTLWGTCWLTSKPRECKILNFSAQRKNFSRPATGNGQTQQEVQPDGEVSTSFCWRRESRPPPAVHQQQHHHHHQVHWDSRRPVSRGDERDVYNAAPPPAPLYLRGRAMSENDLRFETSQRWSPSIYAASSQTLSEMEEGGDSSSSARQRKKKTPPPPRPPPPKWEQFHRRRASHHALLASSAFAAPQPVPSAFDSAEGRYSDHSSSYVPPPDESRQRSYSLPPERQEASETCSRCSCSQTQTQEHAFSQSPAPFQEHAFAVAQSSPMFSRSGSLDEEELELFPPSGEGESGIESWREASQSVEHSTNSLDRQSGASSSCSSYYHTSAAKAQLLSQMKDFTDSREKHEDDELTYKKQLMESLRKKLGVLREAQRGLQEDIRANAQLGDEVENMVVSVCKPNEVDKYRMFIGDLDKVVSLMLSLSGRLLRVETTLDTLDPETEHQDRLPLLEKKRQLMRQLSEAQDLKDHVDRREQAVSRVLARCLTPEQHRDYSHFVKMKAALLVEQRQLEDKIRLGEEQLRGLRESLGLGLGLGMGMGISMGYGHY
uniref:Shroom family member 4 n=1 Tax=Poecilia formosa TaxID=48698 RepID=A0A096LYR2_POEFO